MRRAHPALFLTLVFTASGYAGHRITYPPAPLTAAAGSLTLKPGLLETKSGNYRAEFGDMLERHIRFEERELFEIAQERLSSDALKEIEMACR